MQFGANKHELIFLRTTKLDDPVGQVQFVVFKNLQHQIAREIMFLIVNYVHEKHHTKSE